MLIIISYRNKEIIKIQLLVKEALARSSRMGELKCNANVRVLMRTESDKKFQELNWNRYSISKSGKLIQIKRD